jgi:hypothetical protein
LATIVNMVATPVASPVSSIIYQPFYNAFINIIATPKIFGLFNHTFIIQ